MKIVVAPDSFKGSLSALQICEAMERGIKRVLPEAEVVKIPMADGGEGTVQALVSSTGGHIEKITVVGPLGEPVEAEYGILGDGQTAVIEMAAASGLPMVPVAKRNPVLTTTFGTGQLMRAALARGCRQLIVGIGGSATTDCGTGMAQALGVRFYSSDGSEITDYMCGGLMAEVARIDLAGRLPALLQATVTVACDVDNPLLGPRGAVMTYSRQKGATDEQLALLEANMTHLIGVVEKTIGRSVRDVPGAGAAGGLGAGLIAFANATLRPGVSLVLQASRFAERIRGASFILTGEGKVDFQTAYGKTISGVAAEAQKQGIPVIVLAGTVEEEAENLYERGVVSLFSTCPGPMSIEEAMAQAATHVEKGAERIVRVLTAVALTR
ncbi:MAG: glycerate kinase [bacterium]|jgi:glycerate kinase|nr:glycerate kinase [candidate division KSB1 bacterium]MDH7559673.1 glycerate kinase [bacterium]